MSKLGVDANATSCNLCNLSHLRSELCSKIPCKTFIPRMNKVCGGTANALIHLPEQARWFFEDTGISNVKPKTICHPYNPNMEGITDA